MDSLTVSSSMLIPSASNVEITPAMLGVLWSMAHELDRRRVPANTSDAVWLEIPSKRLRNPDGKDDNQWLKTCLDRLMGVKLSGDYRGDEWAAVILAQWELTQGGSMTRLLVPPAAINAIRAPKTFAKIEITAAYKLKGHARRLYAALADKKHQAKKLWHEYSLDELRGLLQVGEKYPRWADFNRYVLASAVEEINDYGTVKLTAKPIQHGRSVASVRFDWDWKTLDDARVTDEENERHGKARYKESDGSAPPLTDEAKRTARLEADRNAFQKWQADNGGTYSQFLDWKKSNV